MKTSPSSWVGLLLFYFVETMSSVKKLKTDTTNTTPHKKRNGSSGQTTANINTSSDEVITLVPYATNISQNTVKVQDGDNTSQQVYLADTRLVQSIAESVDGTMKRSEDGVKHYGPFYLEIPLMEKTDNNNKNVSLKDPGGQEPVKEEQKRKELEKLLTCQGCLERLHPPISVCNKVHYNCNRCSQAKSHRCFACGERVGYSHLLQVVNDIICISKFQCKYGQSGCSFIEVPKALSVHESSCEYQDLPCMLFKNGEFCHSVIPIRDYLNHIQNFHKHCIRGQFKFNKANEMILPKKPNLERNRFYFRALKDDEKSVCFIESIFYDDAAMNYQISVHYVGKKSEASDYIYTIDILRTEFIQEYRYSNQCLPTMPPMDAKRFHPFILPDRENCFSIHRPLRYNLTITKKIVFDAFSCPQIVKPRNVSA